MLLGNRTQQRRESIGWTTAAIRNSGVELAQQLGKMKAQPPLRLWNLEFWDGRPKLLIRDVLTNLFHEGEHEHSAPK